MRTWMDVVSAELIAAGFVATLLAAAAGAYLALRALNPVREDRFLLVALASAIGPLSAAFIASLALRFAPGQWPALAYLFVPVAIVIIVGVALRLLPQRVASAEPAQATWTSGIFLRGIGTVAAITVGVGLVALFVMTALAPMFGNDSLEYAAAGRLVAESRSLTSFPFLDGEATGGLVTPWTHPPAQVTLLALGFLIEGDVTEAAAMKWIAPYFAASQALLLAAFAAHGANRYVGYIAALLAASAPLVFDTALQNHIDTMRLAAFTAAIAGVWLLLKRETLGACLVAGLACACSGFTHSLGMLTMGLAMPAYLILSQAPLPTRIRNTAIVLVLGASFVVPTIALNLQIFGNPIQDQVPAWELPTLRYSEYLELDRGLESPFRRVVFGLLRSFTEPEFFGLTFWALALGLGLVALNMLGQKRLPVWADLKRVSQDQSTLCVLVIGGFFAALVLTMAADSLSAIKNARYPATILPLAAIAAARLLSRPLATKT